MLFRIDLERFLTHAIDHFTKEELLSFKYAIISSSISNGGLCDNVTKVNSIYPDIDTQVIFKEVNDKTILKKMYYKWLDEIHNVLYTTFINPILKHNNIMIICQESENMYIDILIEYMNEKFDIECVDLNKLFIRGKINNVQMNMKKIHNRAVSLRRSAVSDYMQTLESTSGGRLKLLNLMSDKEKINKLKALGISINKADNKSLDNLLTEIWVEDD